MRSTIHGSLGKFTVPMPVYRRVPSNSCITDAWPLKPRAERPVPPSPGVPMKLMPGLRVTAAWTLGLLRRRTSSPLMLLVLAGVSRALRPRREPALTGVARSMWSSSAGSWRTLTNWLGRARAASSVSARAGGTSSRLVERPRAKGSVRKRLKRGMGVPSHGRAGRNAQEIAGATAPRTTGSLPPTAGVPTGRCRPVSGLARVVKSSPSHAGAQWPEEDFARLPLRGQRRTDHRSDAPASRFTSCAAAGGTWNGPDGNIRTVSSQALNDLD